MQAACTALKQTTAILITSTSLPRQLRFTSVYASIMHSFLCAVQTTFCTQVWRPLRGPVQDSPLAVCDAATTKQADLLATSLHFPDRTGEVYNVMHSRDHR